MRGHPLLRAFALLTLVPCALIAQGANVDVTVYPQASAGQTAPPRDGFTVCLGTSADYDQYGTQVTPFSGVANQNFRNLPVGGTAIATVTKAGYIGARTSRTLTADWTNHLQVTMNPGSGGPTCSSTVAPVPAPAPAPAPAPVSVSATTSIPITAFVTIGATNTTRVAYYSVVPITASFVGVRPTHVRIWEGSPTPYTNTEWQPVTAALTHRFTTLGTRTLGMQGRIGSTSTSPLTTIAIDRVEVVGISTQGIVPAVVGSRGTAVERLECTGVGHPLKSIWGRKGLWIDAVGVTCSSGVNRGPVGGPDGFAFTAWDFSECPAGTYPGTLSMNSYRYNSPIPGLGLEIRELLQVFRLSGCKPYPNYGFAPRRVVAATGPDCPTNSLPLAIDVHTNKAINGAKFVSGVGLLCVAPGQ